MNSKEILMVVDAVSNEKGIDTETIFQAIESALATASKKLSGTEIDARVVIDRVTGEYDTFRRWEIFEDDSEDFEDPDTQIKLTYALKKNPDVQAGEFIEEPMESAPFGRIAAQAAKQVIVQKIREAERAQVVESYQSRIGELVMGVVKRLDKGSIILDLGGNVEAMVARDEIIPREAVRPGDRLRGYLADVRSEVRGPQLFVSRTAPQLLIELFKLEVPEVGEGLIDILGAARDPGSRAKIAVRSNDARIDPVGACVGMRGSRVRAVSNELGDERVDIILWDENNAQFVINAMSPAEVTSIIVDEDSKTMDIAVDDEQLSQAIGRGGQNVRLASELTGWNINVMSETQLAEKSDTENAATLNIFMEQLDVDGEVANILVQEGFSSVEEIAYVPLDEMLQIEEFDESMVNELRNRSKDVLLTRALVQEEVLEEKQPAEDLLNMNGMDQHLAFVLASHDVITMEDLAEQSVDELIEIEGMDEERAASLIMTAREPWFADDGLTEQTAEIVASTDG
ncbi:MAG: transcription termination/antitermination protein NusA [Gammaproteobacteria bacterium]|nr:transcription termination/antitermination protein NusA [Gammaproteobacteria bacterium]